MTEWRKKKKRERNQAQFSSGQWMNTVSVWFRLTGQKSIWTDCVTLNL